MQDKLINRARLQVHMFFQYLLPNERKELGENATKNSHLPTLFGLSPLKATSGHIYMGASSLLLLDRKSFTQDFRFPCNTLRSTLRTENMDPQLFHKHRDGSQASLLTSATINISGVKAYHAYKYRASTLGRN